MSNTKGFSLLFFVFSMLKLKPCMFDPSQLRRLLAENARLMMLP